MRLCLPKSPLSAFDAIINTLPETASLYNARRKAARITRFVYILRFSSIFQCIENDEIRKIALRVMLQIKKDRNLSPLQQNNDKSHIRELLSRKLASRK